MYKSRNFKVYEGAVLDIHIITQHDYEPKDNAVIKYIDIDRKLYGDKIQTIEVQKQDDGKEQEINFIF